MNPRPFTSAQPGDNVSFRERRKGCKPPSLTLAKGGVPACLGLADPPTRDRCIGLSVNPGTAVESPLRVAESCNALPTCHRPEHDSAMTRNTRPTCAGRVLPPHWRVRLNYALTSSPCGAWLGMSSSSSPVRRAWANPRPTSTAMIPASANAAMAHQKAISAIRLNP